MAIQAAMSTNTLKMGKGQSSERRRQRRRVIAQLEANRLTSASAIARRLGKSCSFVNQWKKRIEAGEDSMEDAPRAGRPLKLSKEEILKARRHLERAQHSTIASATDLINSSRPDHNQVSPQTVRRHVKKGEGSKLQYTEPCHQKVSNANATKRKAATSKKAIKGVKSKINSLVFLDAALVRWREGQSIKPYRRGKQWTNRQKPRAQDLRRTKLFQFYAAITKGPDGGLHRHPLIFVPASGGLDAQHFVSNVAKPVQRWARDSVFSSPDFEFVQDNASCHTAEFTEEWMVLNDYRVHDHPPQSPDLNRIEKAWAYFKSQLKRRRPRTEAGFHRIMQEVWRDLDSSVLKKFIDELPDMMGKVHEKPQSQVAK